MPLLRRTPNTNNTRGWAGLSADAETLRSTAAPAKQDTPSSNCNESKSQGSQVGAENTKAGWAGQEKERLAKEYVEACQAPFSKEAAEEAARKGNQLLLCTASVAEAARQVNKARVRRDGEHLAEAQEGRLRGLSEEHSKYLKACVDEGVPSWATKPPNRAKDKNHGSVRGYEQEMLQKAWKDASYGAALLCSAETGDPSVDSKAEEVLTTSGISESPMGRVPKQNPDRTLSNEGRPINDMRGRNAMGSKYDHPQW